MEHFVLSVVRRLCHLYCSNILFRRYNVQCICVGVGEFFFAFDCQKIPIPSSEKNERNSDGSDSFDEDEEEEELKELTKVPKLHLRPKTAPSVEGRRGVRYVTWNEAQQKNGPKRPSSASKSPKNQRDLWSKVRNPLIT